MTWETDLAARSQGEVGRAVRTRFALMIFGLQATYLLIAVVVLGRVDAVILDNATWTVLTLVGGALLVALVMSGIVYRAIAPDHSASRSGRSHDTAPGSEGESGDDPPGRAAERGVARLRSLERRLADFLTDRPDLTVKTDRDARILACNAAFARMAGVSRRELIGRSLFEYFDELTGSGRPARECFAELIEQRSLVPTPVTFCGSRGKRRMTAFARVELDDNGEVIAARALYKPVGRYADDAWKFDLANEKAPQYLDRLPVMVWRANPDGTLAYINRKLRDFLGAAADEVVGASGLDLIHPEDRPRYEEALAKSLGKRREYVVDYRVRRADGELRWVRDRGCVYHLANGQFGAIGVARDVQDEYDMRARLDASDAKLIKAFRAAPDAMFVMRLHDGLITDANAGFERLFGCRVEDVVGRTRQELGLLADEGEARRLQAIVESRDSASKIEARIRRLDDGQTVETVTSYQSFAIEGKRHLIISTSDVTEERRARARIERYQVRLRELAKRLATVQEAERKRLAEDLHDNVIQMLVSIKMDLSRHLNGRPEELRLSMRRSIGNVAELVQTSRDLLHDLVPAIPEALEFGASIAWLGDRIGGKFGIRVSTVTSGNLTDLPDPLKSGLFRAIRELVTNVAKHAAGSGAWIEIDRSDAAVVARVSDQGPGFPADADTGEQFGLFEVHEIVRALGGQVRQWTGAAGGAFVEITVPVAMPAQPDSVANVLTKP